MSENLPNSSPKISILIPVLMDGVDLKNMIRILHEFLEVPHEILVIPKDPDQKTNLCLEEMKKNSHFFRLIEQRDGKDVAALIRAGVHAARGEYVLIFAADEVGPIIALKEMLCLVDQGCRMVSCTRYAHGGKRLGGPFFGKILSRWANFLFYKLFGGCLTDSTTGIKLFQKNLFYELQLKAKNVGWVLCFEMAIKSQLAQVKMGEVPIISVDRLYGGESTFHFSSWFKEYLKWFIWGGYHLRKIKKPQQKALVMQPSEWGQ